MNYIKEIHKKNKIEDAINYNAELQKEYILVTTKGVNLNTIPFKQRVKGIEKILKELRKEELKQNSLSDSFINGMNHYNLKKYANEFNLNSKIAKNSLTSYSDYLTNEEKETFISYMEGNTPNLKDLSIYKQTQKLTPEYKEIAFGYSYNGVIEFIKVLNNKVDSSIEDAVQTVYSENFYLFNKLLVMFYTLVKELNLNNKISAGNYNLGTIFFKAAINSTKMFFELSSVDEKMETFEKAGELVIGKNKNFEQGFYQALLEDMKLVLKDKENEVVVSVLNISLSYLEEINDVIDEINSTGYNVYTQESVESDEYISIIFTLNKQEYFDKFDLNNK